MKHWGSWSSLTLRPFFRHCCYPSANAVQIPQTFSSDKESINQSFSPEASGGSGGAAEITRTTIKHVQQTRNWLLWKSGKNSGTKTMEGTQQRWGRRCSDWRGAFSAYVQNATLCLDPPNVKPNTPPRLWEMVAAAPAGLTGSWTVLVGRQMELVSGQSCRSDTEAEIHHPEFLKSFPPIWPTGAILQRRMDKNYSL